MEDDKEKKQENAMLGGTVVLSIVIALALFFALPYFLSGFFKKVISSQMLIAFIEGVIRLAIFLGYIAIISHCSSAIWQPFPVWKTFSACSCTTAPSINASTA